MKVLAKFARWSVMLAVIVTTIQATAWATPSTLVWIPSPDLQKWGTVHLGVDNYFTMFTTQKGGAYALPTDMGITVGAFPGKIFGVELGVDMFQPSDHPWYFNGKLGLREGGLTPWFPAIVAGIYNVGTEPDETDLNMVYGLVAKSVWKLGRFSVGYYQGNPDLLVNNRGEEEPGGILAGWDRTMSEISDKLWLAVDYQGGNNAFCAVNFGFAWYFAPNVSVILGYDIYTLAHVKDTLTIQLDIDLGKPR